MSHCQYDSLHLGAWHHSRTEKSAATLCRVKIKTTLVWEKTTFLTFPESYSYLIITCSWYFTAFSSLWSINTSCVTTALRHFGLLFCSGYSYLWSPYVIGQTIIFSSCSFFLLLFFSSPNLSGRRLDVYHTSTHGVALVRI